MFGAAMSDVLMPPFAKGLLETEAMSQCPDFFWSSKGSKMRIRAYIYLNEL